MALALFVSCPAFAWDTHRKLNESFLDALPEALKIDLSKRFRPSSPGEWDRDLAPIIARLQLNRSALARNPKHPSPLDALDPFSMLLSNAIDEPDDGMDQDLPESADPRHYRKWMGGTAGPTSQGFRHMFFAGLEWLHPLSTFQVPTKAVGEAPERYSAFMASSKTLLEQGHAPAAWRVGAWAIHYIQDLTQPFHTNQVPNLRMVPWSSLVTWPPQDGFQNLVRETTRVLSNYHWAYEGWVLYELSKQESLLKECIKGPIANLKEPIPLKSLLKEAIEDSRETAEELGAAALRYFGPGLAHPETDLPKGRGALDYAELDADPLLDDFETQLLAVTCRQLKTAKNATLKSIAWLLTP